jgi:hypothetical protein
MDLLLLFLRLLLAAALYLFLGAVLVFLWRDLRRPTASVIVPQRKYGRLVVVDAYEAETDGAPRVGTTFPLQPVTSMGRSPANTITISDAYASSEHALLLYKAGQWWLEDRGSRNGTTLNNILIENPTVVSGGDIVGIGRVQLKLELADS